MKKGEEFLLLFVPLLVLTVLSLVAWVIGLPETDFMGLSQYIRLLLNDRLFWRALFHIYGTAVAFSGLAVILFALLCRFIKCMTSRKVFYSISVVLSSLVTFFSAYLTANFSTPAVYDVLLAVQIGFLTTFLFWLAETLIVFIKARKTK